MDPFLPRSEQDTPGWGPEVIVIHPPSFDAVQEAITALQDQATVVVNLSALPENQLQRAEMRVRTQQGSLLRLGDYAEEDFDREFARQTQLNRA